MQKIIEYEDKVALYHNSNIPDINKVNDTDMNEIKSIVNGSLQGTNAMGSIVVDDINCKNMWIPELYVGETAIQQSSCNVSIDDGVYSFKATASDIFFGNVRTTAGQSYEDSRGTLYKVLPNTKYTLTCSNTAFNKNFVTFYGSDKLSISFLQFTNTLTFTTPANCYYINFRIGKGDATNGTTYTTTIQLEKGSVATTYTPYKKIIKEENGYVKENTTFYANDFKCRNMLGFSNIRNGIYKIGDGTYDGSGTTSCCTTSKIEIDNTKNYVLSTANTQTTSYMYVMYYDASGNYLGYINAPFSTGFIKLNTYSNYSNAKYVNFRFDVAIANLINPQLEIGNEATPYTPYKNFENEEIYSTNEMVIGKWIDGKPLYRKVINVTLPNNNISETSHNISNINIITKIDGFTISTDRNTFTPINTINVGALANGIQIWTDKSKIYVRSGVDYSNYTGYAIIEYTKTTD